MSDRAQSGQRVETGLGGYRYVVSIRLRHPSADPASFTAGLGLEPKYAEVVGQPIVRKEKPSTRVARESYWVHEFEPAEGDLDVEEFLLQKTTELEVHSEFFRRLKDSGGEAEFFIGYFLESWNTGFELTPELQRACAGLGFSLSFDIYTYVPGESAAST